MALTLAMSQSAYVSSSHAPAFLTRNPSHIWKGSATEIPATASWEPIVFRTESTHAKTLICWPFANLCNSSNSGSSTRRKHSGLVLAQAEESNKEKPQRNVSGSAIRTTGVTEYMHLDSEVVHRPASPKEALRQDWRQYQGSENWVGLLGDELDRNLRREIIKYGEFAQATYDAFDFDSRSKYCGSCRYSGEKIFDKVGLYNTGYKITKYLYAMSDIHMPKWLGRAISIEENPIWSKDSNWMGYVAVSTDEEVEHLGRRDIVVAWRGTVTQVEWMEDFKDILYPVGEAGSLHENSSVKVERGFLSVYTSKNPSTRYNKLSASEQVIKELGRLVDVYTQRGEDVSITITGHSLGGALALLNAYEVAAKGLNAHKAHPDRTVPVTVFSFGAPRVGNNAFKDRLKALGVKVLRVVTKKDIVPKMPGIILNEGMEIFEQVWHLLDDLPWTYTHVGVELMLDHRDSLFLKQNHDPAGFHNLEGYLHLLDGFESSCAPFRWNAQRYLALLNKAPEKLFRWNEQRDVALVNKASDMLRHELMVPGKWYQAENKGLVRNCYGRWVQPERDPEDVPSPNHVQKESQGFEFQLMMMMMMVNVYSETDFGLSDLKKIQDEKSS